MMISILKGWITARRLLLGQSCGAHHIVGGRQTARQPPQRRRRTQLRYAQKWRRRNFDSSRCEIQSSTRSAHNHLEENIPPVKNGKSDANAGSETIKVGCVQ